MHILRSRALFAEATQIETMRSTAATRKLRFQIPVSQFGFRFVLRGSVNWTFEFHSDYSHVLLVPTMQILPARALFCFAEQNPTMHLFVTQDDNFVAGE